jgi:hypothetical protein
MWYIGYVTATFLRLVPARLVERRRLACGLRATTLEARR